MSRFWYMDNDDGVDQREPHRPDGTTDLDVSILNEIGILKWKIGPKDYEDNEVFQKIRDDRGYNYKDIISVSTDTLPDYEKKIKMFFEEHLHSDEEVRFILEGSGYFDVRDKSDKWIRIEVLPGDLITLPAGIYHRFTLDTKNYIKAVRLFKGEPVWTPHNRPCDDHPARQSYLATL